MSEHRDDSQMSRFDRPRCARLSAVRGGRDRDHGVLLVLFSGGSVATRRPRSTPGSAATIVAARRRADRAGSPTRCRSPTCRRTHLGALPRRRARRGRLRRGRRRSRPPRPPGSAGDRRTPSIPTAIGAPRPPKRLELDKLLVTGDSLVGPMDSELARRLAARGRRGRPRPEARQRDLRREFLDWGSSRPPRSETRIPTRWSCSSAPARAWR